jgi:hypothetical protein
MGSTPSSESSAELRLQANMASFLNDDIDESD